MTCFALTLSPTCFNPRLRAGGDLCLWLRSMDEGCFNPRLRAGGDSAAKTSVPDGWVSIHASAQEATCCNRTKGERCLSFNPRLRAGGDNPDGEWEFETPVSIHASAQEATTILTTPT